MQIFAPFRHKGMKKNLRIFVFQAKINYFCVRTQLFSCANTVFGAITTIINVLRFVFIQ